MKLTSVCVYCGSRVGRDPRHRAAAQRLGTLLGEKGIRLVYGGGGIGLMGVVADAALAAGGEVVGIIPDHLRAQEVGHRRASELVVVDSMHARKHLMFRRSDAFAVLPGGLGTLDETFEIITWKLLGLHDKPIVIHDNAGYWAPLLALVEHSAREGFTADEATGLFSVVRDVEEILPTLERSPSPRLPARPERA